MRTTLPVLTVNIVIEDTNLITIDVSTTATKQAHSEPSSVGAVTASTTISMDEMPPPPHQIIMLPINK